MNDCRNKIILDLCGGTGAWSQPYKEAGYDVRNITLPDYDVCTYTPPEKVYGILVAPPCTVFSLANWRQPPSKRDFTSGIKIIKACFEIIWKCQGNGNILKFWALENPQSHTRKILGHPVFTFQGWQFGELGDTYATKRTDIWGYFNIPKTTIKRRPDLIVTPTRHSKKGWYSPQKPEWLKDKKLTRSDIRGITPIGFAEAFFKANR